MPRLMALRILGRLNTTVAIASSRSTRMWSLMVVLRDAAGRHPRRGARRWWSRRRSRRLSVAKRSADFKASPGDAGDCGGGGGGGGGRTRTSDTGLMRPLLCHLSYAAAPVDRAENLQAYEDCV